MMNAGNLNGKARQMKDWRRRFVALAAALTLLISSCGLTAFAESDDDIYSAPVTAPIAPDTSPEPEEGSAEATPAPEGQEETGTEPAEGTGEETGTEPGEETGEETGTGTEGEPEVSEEPVDLTAYEPGTLTAEADDIAVTLDYTAEARIPEGTVFTLARAAGGDLYTAMKSAARVLKEEQNETWKREMGDEALFYLLTLTTPEGTEIHPTAGVTLTCTNLVIPADATGFVTGSNAENVDWTGDLNIEFLPDAIGYAYLKQVQIGTVTLVHEDRDYMVTASYGPDAGFPVGTRLKVREIMPGTPEYTLYSGMTDEALNEDWSEITLERYFDISFVKGEAELEPQAGVDVQITFRDKIEENEDTEVAAVHIENNEANVIESETDSQKAAKHDDEAIDTVAFTSDSFSVYGVVQKKKIVTKILDAQGHTYEIEVTYTQEAEIPEDAQVKVEEIPEGSDLWEAYRKQTAAALNADDVRLPGLYDISIVDAEGNKVEPKAAVNVAFKLLNDDTTEDIQVVHFKEEIPQELVEAAAQTQETADQTEVQIEPLAEEDKIASEEIQASVEGDTVTFDTDSFSVYAFAYTIVTYYKVASGETYKITLNYDENSGIPAGSVLKVDEILPGDELFNEYLERALQAAKQTENGETKETETAIAEEGTETSVENLTTEESADHAVSEDMYARFFDIEIRNNDQKIEPTGKVDVTIELEDLPEENDQEELKVVHFGEQGTELLNAEINTISVQFATESFSVYGVIAFPTPSGGTGDLNGRSFLINHNGQYLTSAVDTQPATDQFIKTNNRNAATVWTFEAIIQNGQPNGYYGIYTYDSNGQKKYMTLTRRSDDAARANAGMGDAAQWFRVNDLGNGKYRLNARNQGVYYNINEWGDYGSTGFAGYNGEDNGRDNLTFEFTDPVVYSGNQYIMLVNYEGEYYAVMNDGTLISTTELSEPKHLEVESAFLWTYEKSNGSTFLYHATDAYEFDGTTNLATKKHYRYINPTVDSCLIQDNKNSEWSKKWDSALTYSNQKVSRNRNYLGVVVDADGTKHIVGQQSEENACTISFLLPTDVLPVSGCNHSVNHIDISVEGSARLYVPLTSGMKYRVGSPSAAIQTVPDGQTIQLQIDQPVEITEQDIINAILVATDKNGDPVDNVYYISGYTGNSPANAGDNSHPVAQVRIEGSFKVADLRGMRDNWGRSLDPYYGTWQQANSDSYVQQGRRDNPIYYSISLTKDIVFEWKKDGQKLYDENGQELTTSMPVELSAKFNYWDETNHCPPIRVWGQYNNWKYNRHIVNSEDNIHDIDSGMDFELSCSETTSNGMPAVHITKYIQTTDGSAISPNDSLVQNFDIYSNTELDSTIIGLNIPTYTKEANYSNYNKKATKSITIGNDGIGMTYVYNIPEGMAYVQEQTPPETITDKSGNVWIFDHTRMETESVFRNMSQYDGKMHTSKDYELTDQLRSVPEILGSYTYDNWENVQDKDKEGKPIKPYNRFLEVRVYNVYKRLTGITVDKKWFVNDEESGAPVDSITFELYRTKTNIGSTGSTIISNQGGETVSVSLYNAQYGNGVLSLPTGPITCYKGGKAKFRLYQDQNGLGNYIFNGQIIDNEGNQYDQNHGNWMYSCATNEQYVEIPIGAETTSLTFYSYESKFKVAFVESIPDETDSIDEGDLDELSEFDGSREALLTISDKELVDTVTISSPSWVYDSGETLEQYALDGSEWHYFVIEKNVPSNYTDTYEFDSDGNITIKNKTTRQLKGRLTIGKHVVEKDGDLETDKPVTGTFRFGVYTVNNPTAATEKACDPIVITLSEEASGTATSDELNVGTYYLFELDDSGAPITDGIESLSGIVYEVTADQTSVSVSESTGGITADIIFTNKVKKPVFVSVQKAWEGIGTVEWPENVTVQIGLYQSVGDDVPSLVTLPGTCTEQNNPVTLNSGKRGTTWDHLPAETEDGVITYTVKEEWVKRNDEQINDFVGIVSGDAESGYTVTNKAQKTIYAKKVWTQNNNEMNAWPEAQNVTFQLQYNAGTSATPDWNDYTGNDAQGNPVTSTKTVDSLDQITFDILPAENEYRVIETEINGEPLENAIVATGTGTSDDPFVVRNDISITINVNKAWYEGVTTTWPADVKSIVVGLFKDELPVLDPSNSGSPYEVSITSLNSQMASFTGIPQYDEDGNIIVYSVKERYAILNDGNDTKIDVNDANSTLTINEKIWTVVNGEITNNSATVSNSTSSSDFYVRKEWVEALYTDDLPTIHFKLMYLKDGDQIWQAKVYSDPKSDYDFSYIPLSSDSSEKWTWRCPVELPSEIDGKEVLYYAQEIVTSGLNVEYSLDSIPAGLQGSYNIVVDGYENSNGVHTETADHPEQAGIHGTSGVITIYNRMPGEYMQMDIKKKILELRGGENSLWTTTHEADNTNDMMIELQLYQRWIDESSGTDGYTSDWRKYGNTFCVGYDTAGEAKVWNDNNVFPVEWHGSAWQFIILNNTQNAGLPRRGFEKNSSGQIVPVRYQYIYDEINVYNYDHTVKSDYQWYIYLPYAWGGNGEQVKITELMTAQDQDRMLNAPGSTLEIIKDWDEDNSGNVSEIYVKVYRRQVGESGKGTDYSDLISKNSGVLANDLGTLTFHTEKDGTKSIALSENNGWSATLKRVQLLPPFESQHNGFYEYYIEETGYMDTAGTVHDNSSDISAFRPVYEKWDADQGEWIPQTTGTLIGTIGRNKLRATNTIPSADYTPVVEKKLSGATFMGVLGDGTTKISFDFNITQINSDGSVPADAYTKDVSTDEDDGTIAFPAIKYYTPGIYYYKITEKEPVTHLDTLKYDTNPVYLKVTVPNDMSEPTGAYFTSLDWTGTSVSKAVFSNTELTKITVNKEWTWYNEDEWPEGYTVQMTLKGDGVKVETTTAGNGDDNPAVLSAGKTGTTWTNLPKYKLAGGTLTEIVYTVEETKVFYTAASKEPVELPMAMFEISGGTVTSGTATYSNAPVKVERHATKVWEDSSNELNLRPASITFTLNAKDSNDKDVNLATYGVETEITIEPTGTGDSWTTADWENLPKYTYDGLEITYSISEELAENTNYTPLISELNTGTNTWTITNKLGIDSVPLTGMKTMRGGESPVDKFYSFILSAAKGTPMPDLATVVDDTASLTVKNQNAGAYGDPNINFGTIVYKLSDMTGMTEINDAEGKFEKTFTYTISETDESATHSTLKYDPAVYTVSIRVVYDSVTGDLKADSPTYTKKSGETTTTPSDITFENEELTTVTVSKAWKDKNNNDAFPVAGTKIILTLYKGVEATETASVPVELDGEPDTGDDLVAYEDSAWHAVWKDLPKYESGQEIVYVIKETSGASGYTVKYNVEGTAEFVKTDQTITNTLNQTDIQIEKVDSTDSTKKLSGAEFQLYKVNSSNQDVLVTDTSIGVDAEGKFTVNETATLLGLTDGDYTIMEVTPPAGYLMLSSAITFTVNGGEVKNILPEGGMVTYAKEEGQETGKLTIGNTAGVELPATGGSGTLIYTVAGMTLIVLAGVLLVSRRKRRT